MRLGGKRAAPGRWANPPCRHWRRRWTPGRRRQGEGKRAAPLRLEGLARYRCRSTLRWPSSHRAKVLLRPPEGAAHVTRSTAAPAECGDTAAERAKSLRPCRHRASTGGQLSRCTALMLASSSTRAWCGTTSKHRPVTSMKVQARCRHAAAAQRQHQTAAALQGVRAIRHGLSPLCTRLLHLLQRHRICNASCVGTALCSVGNAAHPQEERCPLLDGRSRGRSR